MDNSGDGTVNFREFMNGAPDWLLTGVRNHSEQLKNPVKKSPVADPNKTYATGKNFLGIFFWNGVGDGLGSNVKENEETTFEVFVRDSDNKAIDVKVEDLDVKVQNSENQTPEQVTIEKSGVGTCKVIYRPENSGKVIVDVKLKGKSIKDSPYNVNIAPVVDPSQCCAKGPGVGNDVIEDEETYFTVEIKDRNKNVIPINLDQLEINIIGTDNKISCQVQESEKGTYKVIYKPVDSGIVNISINVDNKPINQSPISVNVQPNVNIKNTTATGNITMK